MTRFTLPTQLGVRFFSGGTIPAALAAPTAAEVAAGVNVVGTSDGEGLADIQGFVSSPSTIETPDYNSHQVGTVPGDTTFPQSTLSIYMDDTTRTVYDAMLPDTVGVVGLFFDGEDATEDSLLFPVTVQNRRRRVARDEAHICDIDVAISVPTEGVIAA